MESVQIISPNINCNIKYMPIFFLQNMPTYFSKYANFRTILFRLGLSQMLAGAANSMEMKLSSPIFSSLRAHIRGKFQPTTRQTCPEKKTKSKNFYRNEEEKLFTGCLTRRKLALLPPSVALCNSGRATGRSRGGHTNQLSVG